MKKLLKQFAEWVIDWKSNEFKRTKRNLAIFYSFTLCVTLIIFSYFLHLHVREMRREQICKAVSADKISFSNKSVEYNICTEGSEFLKKIDKKFQDEILEKIWQLSIITFAINIFFSYFLAGKTLKPIRKKIAQQKQFISDASHELRNPLSVIKILIGSLLKKSTFTNNERKSLENIQEETDRLITISEDLLLIDNNQNGSANNVQIDALINNICAKLTPLASEKNIIFVAELAAVNIQSSSANCEKILFNILHNAIKFSNTNSQIKIKLTTDKILTIQDFGIGINKKDLPFIFDRFFKSDNARSFSKYNGSGLGLSISKELLERMNTKIKISSQEGSGTTVTIFF